MEKGSPTGKKKGGGCPLTNSLRVKWFNTAVII